MKKFRGKVVVTIITKPLVVEAADEADAYQMLKNIPDQKLLEFVDSVATEIYNAGGREATIVRVPYSEEVTYSPPRETTESQKLDTLIEILSKNAELNAKLLEAKNAEQEARVVREYPPDYK